MAAATGNELEQGAGLSKGDRVKQDGRVLRELAINLEKPANVACRVEKFGNIVESFDKCKKKWVAEMGFDGLLWLVGSHLPRTLCYWLASRVDCEQEALVAPDGMTFPLSAAQVHWVFSLPHGPNPVPNKIKGKRMRKEEKSIWTRYGSITDGGTREIKGKAIIDAVDNPEDELEFKRAFLMFALNEVLCPTTSTRLSLKLLPAVTVYEEAHEYEWLRRPPIRWGLLPRIKVWRSREVNKAKSLDRIRQGDYGKLGCVDVAYGERHFSGAKDSFPSSRAATTAMAHGPITAEPYYTYAQFQTQK